MNEELKVVRLTLAQVQELAALTREAQCNADEAEFFAGIEEVLDKAASPPSDLHNKLLEKFKPIVLEHLVGAWEFNCEKLGLQFRVIEDHDSDLAHVCELVITPGAESIGSDDLEGLVHALDEFCGWEDELGSHDKPVMIDGTDWYIGDGDDTGAVTWHADGIHIWVRHFKE